MKLEKGRVGILLLLKILKSGTRSIADLVAFICE